MQLWKKSSSCSGSDASVPGSCRSFAVTTLVPAEWCRVDRDTKLAVTGREEMTDSVSLFVKGLYLTCQRVDESTLLLLSVVPAVICQFLAKRPEMHHTGFSAKERHLHSRTFTLFTSLDLRSTYLHTNTYSSVFIYVFLFMSYGF